MESQDITKEILKLRKEIEYNTYDTNIETVIRLLKEKKLIYLDLDLDLDFDLKKKSIVEYIFLESLILKYPKTTIEIYRIKQDELYTYDRKVLILYEFIEKELKLKGYLLKPLLGIKYKDLENIIRKEFMRETITIIKYYK